MAAEKSPAKHSDVLFRELRTLIEKTRSNVATTVNAGLTMLYWQVGRRIREEVLKGERAGYGEQIVATLSRQLVADAG